MSYFPHFLNWLPATIAAAIAIPALLILYFLKLRRREMAVPSTFLWKKSIQDLQVNSPFQKLRRNLLLLLQLLLLILLLLSLARPVTNYRPGAGQRTVILIDRSASMSARDFDNGKTTRLDEAKRRARELIDSMGRHASAMVIAFDDSAQTVQQWTTDTVALRHAVDSIRGTDRRTRLKLAFQLAEASTNANVEQHIADSEPADIRLFSDGRTLDDPTDLSVHGHLVFERIGTDNAQNVAIVALNAKRNYERPTQVQIFARLANYGADPVSVPVQLSVDGEVVNIGGSQTRDTYLLPDRWSTDQREAYEKQSGKRAVDSVEFELDLLSAAVIKLEQLRKEGDVLSSDDVAQVVVPPPKTLSVLLVTDGNYFLEKAINSLGIQKPTVMRPAAYEAKAQTEFDVIIFDRYKPQHLSDAGNFIYFLDGARAALPANLKVKVAQENGMPVLLSDQGVLDWKRDHPILSQLAMSKLYIAEAAKLQVPPDAEVLLDGLKGPLMVLQRQGKMTNLIVAFDVLQSNWPLKVSFPIFLHNALQYLAIGSDMNVRKSFSPGATPLIPRTALQKLGDDVKKIRLKGPEGTIDVPIPESGDFVLPQLNYVGLYSTEPAVPGYEQLAVNLLDESESNLLPADKAPGDATAPVEEVKETRARLELWWWIAACLVLPLLYVEWWVYTQRVHL